MTVTLLASSTDRRVQRRLCLCGAQFEAAVQTLKRPQFVILARSPPSSMPMQGFLLCAYPFRLMDLPVIFVLPPTSMLFPCTRPLMEKRNKQNRKK